MKFHFSIFDVLDVPLLFINWQTYYLAPNCNVYELSKCMK